MAERRELKALKEAWRFGEDEYQALADEIYATKIEAYLLEIERLLATYGYEADFEEDDIPEPVRAQLEEDSESSARSVVKTFNRDMARFIENNRERDLIELQELLEDWAEDRASARAALVAVTDAYGPHADATIAFFQAAGVEPEFDFGGHGDAEPQCELCQALREESPHPLSTVVEIGTPHINCRQEWHPVGVGPRDLPDEFELADLSYQGIAGGPTLLERAGSLDAAAERVRGDTA